MRSDLGDVVQAVEKATETSVARRVDVNGHRDRESTALATSSTTASMLVYFTLNHVAIKQARVGTRAPNQSLQEPC